MLRKCFRLDFLVNWLWSSKFYSGLTWQVFKSLQILLLHFSFTFNKYIFLNYQTMKLWICLDGIIKKCQNSKELHSFWCILDNLLNSMYLPSGGPKVLCKWMQRPFLLHPLYLQEDTIWGETMCQVGYRISQCKLIGTIKKQVNNEQCKYVCISLVHACRENWQYAL